MWTSGSAEASPPSVNSAIASSSIYHTGCPRQDAPQASLWFLQHPSEQATGHAGVKPPSSHLISRRALHLFQVLLHHCFWLGWCRCTRQEEKKREEIRYAVRYDGHVQGELERRGTSKSLARMPRRKVRVRGGEEAALTDPYKPRKGFAIRNGYHWDCERRRWENALADVGALCRTPRGLPVTAVPQFSPRTPNNASQVPAGLSLCTPEAS